MHGRGPQSQIMEPDHKFKSGSVQLLQVKCDGCRARLVDSQQWGGVGCGIQKVLAVAAKAPTKVLVVATIAAAPTMPLGAMAPTMPLGAMLAKPEGHFLLTKNPVQENMKVRHFFAYQKSRTRKKMNVRHFFTKQFGQEKNRK